MKNKWINKIHLGNSLQSQKAMPDNLVDMVMTSPPYWGLRDYGTDGVIWNGAANCKHKFNIKTKAGDIRFRGENSAIGNNKNPEIGEGSGEGAFCRCGAWKGELGLEPTFELYIKHLCDIFDETKRVLKDTGTMWVNLGDTYNGSGGAGNQYAESRKRHTSFGKIKGGVGESLPTNVKNYPTKSLCMIPQRFAIEMVNRGWILRNVIIWYKSNCMPSSVKDRFTVDFEYLYFFSKQKKYYFEQQFEELQESSIERAEYGWHGKEIDGIGRNQPSATEKMGERYAPEQGRNKRCVWNINPKPFSEAHFAVYPEELCITPIKAGCKEGGVVLDPFAGAGTTCLVARKLGRQYIGIEIKSEYKNMAERRIHNAAGLL